MPATDKLQRALLDPSSVFAAPQDILADTDMTKEQKSYFGGSTTPPRRQLR